MSEKVMVKKKSFDFVTKVTSIIFRLRYHRIRPVAECVLTIFNTTGATTETVSAKPFEAPEINPGKFGVLCLIVLTFSKRDL